MRWIVGLIFCAFGRHRVWYARDKLNDKRSLRCHFCYVEVEPGPNGKWVRKRG